jgi:sugar O-acyltransferase (sialic acid O-acetyltransferase NeuD family)
MKKNNLQKICILGSGGHATSCIDLIESTSKFEIIGIISQKNDKNHEKKFLNKYRIIGSDKDYKKILNICKNIVIGVSFYKDLSLRSKMFKDLKKAGFKLPVICSPRSHVSLGSKIDEGSQIFHNVTINKNVIIGKNCIINSHALIEHDVLIDQNSQVSTGAIINGGCIVKENSFIGSGSVLRENIVIKKKSFIKMGSIIKK